MFMMSSLNPFYAYWEKINHLLYKDVIKIFGKIIFKKEFLISIEAIRINSQYIEIEFGIEKRAMLLKKEIREITDAIECLNMESIRSRR